MEVFHRYLLIVILAITAHRQVEGSCLGNYKYKTNSDWMDGGKWKSNVRIEPNISNKLKDWTVQLIFKAPLASDIEAWVVDGTHQTKGKSQVILKPKSYNREITSTFSLTYTATFANRITGTSHLLCAQFCGTVGTGKKLCSGKIPITDAPTKTVHRPSSTFIGKCRTKYNYNVVLAKSLLFYEAQRSGKLPLDQKVKWRKDSTLNDGRDVGKDLSGGYFDAGDYVKFNFPMASTITVLAWGMIEFEKGYTSSALLSDGLKTIKWGTDYFIKCHTKRDELHGQVGNGDMDHKFWGRPQDMTMKRPSYKIDKTKPGSDLAGETAAALAATSIVFKRNGDVKYAAELLSHAKELFEFARSYRQEYHLSITDAGKFYKSYSGYKDELAWSCLWLYKATGNAYYKNIFLKDFDNEVYQKYSTEFSWDNKWLGVKLLAQQLKISTKDYTTNLNSLLKSQKFTPKGLFFVSKWGSNRHAANLAFLALIAADVTKNHKFYDVFARKQIHYMLGDSGRSYVVGFGFNPPLRPHHASSSCPTTGKCDWNTFSSNSPNAHILNGALVGGPDQYDNYVDVRSDYIKNEVTCDYNAGFQSAVAGLIQRAEYGNC